MPRPSLSDPVIQARAKESQAEMMKLRQEAFAKQYRRAERILRKLDLWKKPTKGAAGWIGSYGEFARILTAWVNDQEFVDQRGEPITLAEAASEIARLGKTIYEKVPRHQKLLFPLTAFLDYLEPDPEARWAQARSEYILIRSSNGTILERGTKVKDGFAARHPDTAAREQEQPVEEQEPAEADEPNVQDDVEVPTPEGDPPAPTADFFSRIPVDEEPPPALELAPPLEDTPAPTNGHHHVSLEALALMARRAEGDVELRNAVAVAERILALELSNGPGPS